MIDVGSSARGIVKRLLVERRSSVKKGQPIAELNAQSEIADLQIAESRADMQGELITRKVDLSMARQDVQRFSILFEKNLTAEKQLDEALA
ncbi:MAG: hypothetical protein AB8B97_06945 [Granulosicoccus sp.]